MKDLQFDHEGECSPNVENEEHQGFANRNPHYLVVNRKGQYNTNAIGELASKGATRHQELLKLAEINKLKEASVNIGKILKNNRIDEITYKEYTDLAMKQIQGIKKLTNMNLKKTKSNSPQRSKANELMKFTNEIIKNVGHSPRYSPNTKNRHHKIIGKKNVLNNLNSRGSPSPIKEDLLHYQPKFLPNNNFQKYSKSPSSNQTLTQGGTSPTNQSRINPYYDSGKGCIGRIERGSNSPQGSNSPRAGSSKYAKLNHMLETNQNYYGLNVYQNLPQNSYKSKTSLSKEKEAQNSKLEKNGKEDDDEFKNLDSVCTEGSELVQNIPTIEVKVNRQRESKSPVNTQTSSKAKLSRNKFLTGARSNPTLEMSKKKAEIMAQIEKTEKKLIAASTEEEMKVIAQAKKKKRMNRDLIVAAENGDYALVSDLLNKQKYGELAADVDASEIDLWTALHYAASEGHLKVACVLIKSQCKIDPGAKDKRTPLHIACVRGYESIAKLLVQSGANINAQDIDLNTPLHFLARHGFGSLIEFMLHQGADFSMKNKQGKTPIELSNSIEIIYKFENFVNGCSGIFSEEEEVQKASKRKVENCPALNTPNFINTEQKKNKLMTRKVKIHESSATPHNNNLTMKYGEDQSNSSSLNTNSSSFEEKIGPNSFKPILILGKGSFGEVYLVQKRSNHQYYAMKVLLKQKIYGQNLMKYAKTERDVLSYTRHPFIVGLHFAFQNSEKLFLLLDYCPGGDLGHVIQREKKFSEDRARMYLCEIILAIEDLHKRDIIFRDLKPDNVVLDSEGHAMLTDFGLSKEGVMNNESAKSFCGSVAYLAPEMLRRSGHGKSVDWYLLGVLFYEMVVGIPPYFDRDRNKLFTNIQKGPLRLPSALSKQAKDLIISLLNRNPNKRLGASKHDAEEIKHHAFFKGISWDDVANRKLPTPKPVIKPMVNCELSQEIFGTSNSSEENKLIEWSFIKQEENKKYLK